MVSGEFNKPKLAINRVYTRRGDSGQTRLVGGQKVPKDSLRIEAYGTTDELNAFVGAACDTAREAVGVHPGLQPMIGILTRVQHELFNLGSILATRPEDVRPNQPRVTDADITQLEKEIDSVNEDLPALQSFLLPGGGRLNVDLHVCRTVCRRAERLCVGLARQEAVPPEVIRYLNRLSDAFFVWSRWASQVMNMPETLWDPNVKG
ncbi:MAG: cob(I)yrinic acid a,c-diamide adenosyltransferase [Acidobacteria bacterium]|nr:cob(I)yrinic acid a,c-diamide adenosyltransferase [Acidobacteriota bacterium]MCI0722592.1 cob(I)yrinic acid a,c-diamide adenosyltransferase [Acidobacteriota bacterium]